MLPQPVDAEVRAASSDATVTVLYESTLENLMCIVEVEMMYDAVTEMGSEHLEAFGVGDDETLRRQWLIGTSPQFLAQRIEVTIEMCLKTPLVWLVALIAAGIEIGLEQVFG